MWATQVRSPHTQIMLVETKHLIFSLHTSGGCIVSCDEVSQQSSDVVCIQSICLRPYLKTVYSKCTNTLLKDGAHEGNKRISNVVILEWVNACRQIGNSLMPPCIRSSRFGNGSIYFTVRTIVVLHFPFTHLHRISIKLLFFVKTVLLSVHTAASSLSLFRHMAFDSLFRRTNCEF